MDKKYRTNEDPNWVEQNKGEGEASRPQFAGSIRRPRSLDELSREAQSHRSAKPVEEEAAAAEMPDAEPAQEAPAPAFREVYRDDSPELPVYEPPAEPMHFRQPGEEPETVQANTKHVRLKRFFFGVGRFFKRHKVLSIVLAVIVVLLLAVVFTVNHFLNKINYVPLEEPVPVAEKELKYITLSTGEVIDVTNLKRNSDGSYNLPDGRRFNRDRTIWNTDGSMVFYDGSYMLPDGTAVLADGTTFYTDELLVFQSGKFYEKTKISVDKEGYVTFFNGVIAHLTSFICAEDGTCTAKASSLSKLKHNVSGTWNAFKKDTGNVSTAKDDDDDEESKIRSALSKTDGLNDDEVAENYNNNEIWYNDDITNILLMGIDEGSKYYPYGRSDSMIVLSVNKKTKAVKMISFSRAVYVAVAGYDNTRLNHAHGYGGAALAIDTIERNYKIRIDNYVETGFETFKQIIDVLEGVPIQLSSAEAKALKGKIIKNGLTYNGSGTYNLNGDLALEYVRLRKIDTDRERTARQRKVLLAIGNKVKSRNVFQLTALANRILPLITTDMSKTEILSQLSTVSTYLNGKVEQYVVPHESSKLTVIDNYEVLIVNWKSEVKYVHKLFYDGVTPSYYSKS